MPRSVIIKIRVADLDAAGQQLLDTARQQSSHLTTILQPRGGLLYAEINNEDTDDIIKIRVESLLTYAERAREFGIQGLERHPRVWSGKDGPQGHPIPNEEYLQNIEQFYGPERVGGMTPYWYIPEHLVRQARSVPDEGARIINQAGEELRQWLDAGKFCVWRDPDWISQTEAAELAQVPTTTLRNAVRDGRLSTWEDPDEPNPQRRTRVRKSEVLKRWRGK